jgi:hypothetical protein
MQNLELPPVILEPPPNVSCTPLLLGLGIVGGFILHACLLRTGNIAYIFTQIGLTLTAPVIGIWLVCLLTIRRNWLSPAQRLRIIMVLAFVVALVMLFFLLPVNLILLDMSARDHIKSIGGEARLQAWAKDFLNKPVGEMPVLRDRDDPSSTIHYLDGKRLPAFVRSVSLRTYAPYGFQLVDNGPGKRYLEISIWNARPHSYGIILCSKNYKISPPDNQMLFEWRDGLYGWQEINEKD